MINTRNGVPCGWDQWWDVDADTRDSGYSGEELSTSLDWCAATNVGIQLSVDFSDGTETINYTFVGEYERLYFDGVVERISYSFPPDAEVDAANQIFACEATLLGDRFVLSGTSSEVVEVPPS